ncbi:MAG TPA: hypothetical protein VK928_04915 [Longimicrobiales bacterium]|nr:hypothetical protein [Longimicrobiales bacterium]
MMVLACAAALAGCRDGVAPYEVPERAIDENEPVRQVTFGSGQDRDPAWMPAGDVILYHTDDYSALRTARGALLRIGAAGGVALPILGELQNAGGRLLATPVVSPDGSRVAYIDLVGVHPLIGCLQGTSEITARCPLTQPLLDSAALRVRGLEATNAPSSDPSVGIRFAGPDPALLTSDATSFEMHALPFQQAYRDHAAVLARPSWAPDNQRIVFSDGLNLRIWRVGDAASSVVPGTTDGVSAAWSPDGARIAYTRMERVDSIAYSCFCSRGPNVSESHRRVEYVTRPTIVTVRPDGSDAVVLGDGDEPAWSPDGQFIYARRGENIVRITVAGGAAVPVPQAGFGRAPAVSPDGRWLAFSRRKPQPRVDWDIWVVSLSQ